MTTNTDALAAGKVLPTNHEGPTVVAVAPQVSKQDESPDFDEVGREGQGRCVDAGKAFATLRAELALRGYTLSRSSAADGPATFYVGRWGMVRELRDLPAVAALLDQVGGAHA